MNSFQAIKEAGLRADPFNTAFSAHKLSRGGNAIRAGRYTHRGRKTPIADAEIPAMIFVADLADRLREIFIDFRATITPDKQGFYGYRPNHRVYYEVMDYTKMLGDAVKRNRIFFGKLNLVDNH
jgi:hypothetical protein